MYKSLYDFYRSKEWVNLMRLLKLERVNAQGELICAHCGKPIYHSRDAIGHHTTTLTPINVNDAIISLNPEKIQILHLKCHNAVHNRFGLFIPQKVYIVYGSPLSGKTTYVRDNKSDNDIVVDMDRLYEAITMQERYIKNSALRFNVFSLRDNLIDQIKTRNGKWQTAWIIGGYALMSERERLAQSLGAELIFIDTDKAECLARLHQDEQRQPVSRDWEKYIDDWFMKYQPDLNLSA